MRLHYPEVGIAPAPPPPGAPHAVRSFHAPTRGPGCPTCGGRVREPSPGGAWAAGGGSSAAALGRLRSSQVVLCGPAKAAAAPGFPPEARTKETLPGFAISELVSGSEQDRTNPKRPGSCPSSHALLSAARVGKPSILHQAPAHQASAWCMLSG